MPADKYIPNARDAVVGYCDKLGYVRCVTCCDRLGTEMRRGHEVYGDLVDTTESACDSCGVTFLALSESCQREHDEQQAKWARGPITHVVEMGMVGAVRCRIY